MSNAFKCDICGEFYDGRPNMIHFITDLFKQPIAKYDVCGFCKTRTIELFKAIAEDHGFHNDFNCIENSSENLGGEENGCI